MYHFRYKKFHMLVFTTGNLNQLRLYADRQIYLGALTKFLQISVHIHDEDSAFYSLTSCSRLLVESQFYFMKFSPFLQSDPNQIEIFWIAIKSRFSRFFT